MKYKVYGTVKIDVAVTVEAENEEEAFEAAYDEFDGLKNYAGNGGCDKLVGTTNRNISLDSGYSEPQFDHAEAQ